jgi:hypothetical protein
MIKLLLEFENLFTSHVHTLMQFLYIVRNPLKVFPTVNTNSLWLSAVGMAYS